MSTLKVTNIQATGETASRAVSGVAAVWSNVDLSIPSTSDSNNQSSFVDNGVGDLTVNFSNSLANSSYVNTHNMQYSKSTTNTETVYVTTKNGSANLTSSLVRSTAVINTGTTYDCDAHTTLVHGDLA